MNSPWRLLCTLHLSTLLLASCSSGINDFAPGLPAGSRATLHKAGVLNPTRGQLGVGVDEHTANKINVNWRDDSSLVHVTPGKHRLRLYYYRQPPGLYLANALRGGTGLGANQPGGMKEWLLVSGKDATLVEWDAKAGHTYDVQYSDDGRHWKAWLKDTYAGKEMNGHAVSAGGALQMKMD